METKLVVLNEDLNAIDDAFRLLAIHAHICLRRGLNLPVTFNAVLLDTFQQLREEVELCKAKEVPQDQKVGGRTLEI